MQSIVVLLLILGSSFLLRKLFLKIGVKISVIILGLLGALTGIPIGVANHSIPIGAGFSAFFGLAGALFGYVLAHPPKPPTNSQQLDQTLATSPQESIDLRYDKVVRGAVMVLIPLLGVLITFLIVVFTKVAFTVDARALLIGVSLILPELYFLKLCESTLVFTIHIDRSQGKIIFRKSFGKVEVNSQNIESWGLSKPWINDRPIEQLAKSSQFFECKFKDGRQFFYPLVNSGIPGVAYEAYTDSYYIELFQKTLGIPPSKYENHITLTYPFQYFKYKTAFLFL